MNDSEREPFCPAIAVTTLWAVFLILATMLYGFDSIDPHRSTAPGTLEYYVVCFVYQECITEYKDQRYTDSANHDSYIHPDSLLCISSDATRSTREYMRQRAGEHAAFLETTIVRE